MEVPNKGTDKRNKSYLKSTTRKDKLNVFTRRLSRNKKRRERQQLKKAACLTVSEGTAAEAGTCAGTSERTIPSTSAADDFLTDRLYEENIENIENVEEMETIEEIVQEGDFYTEEHELNTTDEDE
ncbi:uncharacterized protein LOC114881708 [Osmia bicornis bicornis]|uniref:uncharacterized protein LOC114881708 n=1 Tax=Osmia bicornis bicornis TaxID=1437191 RepID=UPI0010F983B5|nr:uncharacterized protein LOC114881708 [Osmia bicornis bicornis]